MILKSSHIILALFIFSTQLQAGDINKANSEIKFLLSLVHISHSNQTSRLTSSPTSVIAPKAIEIS